MANWLRVILPRTMPKDRHKGRAFGDWRSPQRSSTAYVRCVLHGLQFMLRSRGLTSLQCKRVMLALRVSFVLMIKHDMDYVFPDDNGQRVCDMACSQLSFSTVKLAHKLENEIKNIQKGLPSKEQVLTAIELNTARLLVEEVRAKLEACTNKAIEMPPHLELSRKNGAKDNERKAVTDPSTKVNDEYTQYMHSLAWEDETNVPDPGQAVFLRKYQAIDLLQIPQKATTRTEAVRALRLCDRLCSLMENQSHCVKNDKFLILALLEHVLTQVVPVPKPRNVGGLKNLAGVDKLKKRMERRKRREARKAKKKAEQDKQRKEAAQKAKAGKQGVAGDPADVKQAAEAAGSKKLKRKKPTKKDKGKEEEKSSSKENDDNEDADEAAEPEDMEEEEPEEKKEKAEGDNEDGYGWEQPDFKAGQKIEDDITMEHCIWDEPITYHLQVELLLTLQRLCEHFAAAVGSIQMSRALDALCLVVPSVRPAVPWRVQ
eukprot:g51159.t1